MNQFEKSQSAKILSCYNIDNELLEKGRKAAPLGDIREYAGKKYIKTDTGWSPYNDIQTLTHKEENNKTNMETNATTPENTKKSSLYKTSYPVIDEILEKMQPKLDELMLYYKAAFEKIYAKVPNKVWTEKDKQNTELALISDVIKATGNYLKKTDKLKSIRVSTSRKGTLQIESMIERDGKDHLFDTEAIVAGGHTIQCTHYRYIVHTDFPSIFNKPYQAIQAKIKYEKESEKILAKIEEQKNNIKKWEKVIEEKSEITKQSIKEKQEQAEIAKYGHVYTYDDLNENAKNYYTPDSYAKEQQDRIDKEYEWKQNEIKWHQSYIKDANKKIIKLEQQYKDHLASEVKLENPEEGDYKVTRAKGNFVHNPIEVHKFENGNWKRVRGTNHKNIRDLGFNSMKDEDVLAYHRKKLEEQQATK